MKKQEMVILILVILAAVLTVCFFLDDNYEKRYFNPDKVNTLNIVIDENIWENLTANPLLEEYVPCSIELNGDTYNNIGIRTSGNIGSLWNVFKDSSIKEMLLNTEKTKRYQFKFKANAYISGYSFRGLDKFVIRNMAQDPTYSKDYLTYELANKLGITVPAYSYVAVYVNGEYFGLYLMLECIDKSFVHRNYGNKNVHIYRPAFLEYKGDNPSNYSDLWQSLVYGIETDENKAHVINAIKHMNNSKNLEEYLDIDAIIAYFALMSAMAYSDSFVNGNNYFLSEVDGIFSLIPWDNDLVLENTKIINSPIYIPNEVSSISSSLNKYQLLESILSSNRYKEKYQTILKEIATNFLDNYMSKRIDEIDAMIGEYVREDPTKFVSYEKYKYNIQLLKKRGHMRAINILEQLQVPPSS